MPSKNRSGKAGKNDPMKIVWWIVSLGGALLILANVAQAIVALAGVVLLYIGLKQVGVLKA
jgi:hypothetical protein